MDQRKTGLFLKELRSKKSVTQAELAEMLGVSNRSVSRWENGATMPDFDLLIELAKYYEVEVGEILDGERRERGILDGESRAIDSEGNDSGKQDKEKKNTGTASEISDEKERRNSSMDSKIKETEELMLKVTDYNNTEYNFFAKRIFAIFTIAVICMGIYVSMDMAELTKIHPYEGISYFALGLAAGMLLLGLLYSSRYMIKVRAAKMRLLSKIRKIRQ